MEGLGGYCRDLGLSSFLCMRWELLECCEWRTDTTDLDLNEITLAAVSGSHCGGTEGRSRETNSGAVAARNSEGMDPSGGAEEQSASGRMLSSGKRKKSPG